jgi:hypothetical protein
MELAGLSVCLIPIGLTVCKTGLLIADALAYRLQVTVS